MNSGTNFQARIQQACQNIGITTDAQATEKLQAYIDQLQRWNKTYNLTALRDPQQMLIQHIFDSLSIVPHIVQILYKNTVFPVKIVDVGSGAGLPGVVLAICNSQWEVTCIDAVEKKMAFVRQMAGALTLPNLHALHQRVETIAPMQAHIVVSRAFASLKDFAQLAGEHVAPTGTLLAMKGQHPEAEIDELHNTTPWRVDRIESLNVPELTAQRCLVWMHRQGNP
jgi:16S rRNA (guanine527-N7)-methyltransferase